MSGIDVEKFNEIPQLKKCLNAARLTTVHKSNEDWVKYIWDNAIEYAEEQAAKRNTNAPTVQREGWVSVPIEPTEEMIDAAFVFLKDGGVDNIDGDDIRGAIRYAIQAAPKE